MNQALLNLGAIDFVLIERDQGSDKLLTANPGSRSTDDCGHRDSARYGASRAVGVRCSILSAANKSRRTDLKDKQAPRRRESNSSPSLLFQRPNGLHPMLLYGSHNMRMFSVLSRKKCKRLQNDTVHASTFPNHVRIQFQFGGFTVHFCSQRVRSEPAEYLRDCDAKRG